MISSQRYDQRGVSASKDDVHNAIKNIDKGNGAATFKTAKQVPKEMRGILPDAKDLAELL